MTRSPRTLHGKGTVDSVSDGGEGTAAPKTRGTCGGCAPTIALILGASVIGRGRCAHRPLYVSHWETGEEDDDYIAHI